MIPKSFIDKVALRPHSLPVATVAAIVVAAAAAYSFLFALLINRVLFPLMESLQIAQSSQEHWIREGSVRGVHVPIQLAFLLLGPIG